MWSAIYSNYGDKSPILNVEVIPRFPQLPITVSAAPPTLVRGEFHPIVVHLHCTKEQVGDLTVHIRLIRGERSGEEWVYEGYLRTASCIVGVNPGTVSVPLST